MAKFRHYYNRGYVIEKAEYTMKMKEEFDKLKEVYYQCKIGNIPEEYNDKTTMEVKKIILIKCIETMEQIRNNDMRNVRIIRDFAYKESGIKD